EDAIIIMKEALDVLEDEQPDESTTLLAERVARALFFTGRVEEARDTVERALSMAEKMQFPDAMSQALNTKSLVLSSLSRPEEAILLLRHSLEIALNNDLGEAALRAYNNIGALMNERDDHPKEYDSASDGLELARKFGNRRWEEGLTLGRITPCLYLGRWDE